MLRATAFLFSIIFASIFTISARAAEIGEVTAKEYYAAAYYKNALEDPRIQKIRGERKKLKKIARSIGMSHRQLKKAISKIDSLDGDPIELATQALKAGFEKTRVKGRILDVLINHDEPKHVVLYIRWQGTRSTNVVKEASAIAEVTSKVAPLISTLSLSAIHPKADKGSKKSVWSAKIGRAAMLRINRDRINDYADRLYGPLFEGVESRPF